MEIGKLSHSLTLPFAPDSEKVEANFDKGARRGRSTTGLACIQQLTV
jgi:hypothetical protein